MFALFVSRGRVNPVPDTPSWVGAAVRRGHLNTDSEEVMEGTMTIWGLVGGEGILDSGNSMYNSSVHMCLGVFEEQKEASIDGARDVVGGGQRGWRCQLL